MKDDVKFKDIARPLQPAARNSPTKQPRPLARVSQHVLSQSSLVNLNVFLHAAIGDGKHDPQTDRDDDAHARPKRAD